MLIVWKVEEELCYRVNSHRDLLLQAGVAFGVVFISVFFLCYMNIANLKLGFFMVGNVSQSHYPFQGCGNGKMNT